MVKVCKYCGKEFDRVVAAPQKYCSRECRIKANQPQQNKIIAEWHRENPVGSILKTLRHRAKRKGLLFDLTKEDIIIPDICPIFGFKLEHNFGKNGGKYNSPSVDRSDNNKGYIKGNVWVISQLANAMKSEASPEQLIKFAEWIFSNYKEEG